MLPFLFYLLCLIKCLLFYGLQVFILLQVLLQKFLCFVFLKKSSKNHFFNCISQKYSRKSNQNYITLHIAEKLKKKKIKLFNQFTRKKENVMVLTKRNFSKDGCCNGFEHYSKKYNEFYKDLPIGFQQIYSAKSKNVEDRCCSNIQTKIKEPFFQKNAKTLSSTDIRLHDYNDLNGIFSNFCLNENHYENAEFNKLLYNKFGKTFNFLEIYDLFYQKRCVDRKCGCTKRFFKVSPFLMMKRKSRADSKNFEATKLTPILENIEYI